MSFPRPRVLTQCAAVAYVGSVAVLGLVDVLAEGSPGGSAAPYVVAFPGSAVAAVLLQLASSLLGSGEPPAGEGAALGFPVLAVAGALVNVSMLWAAVSFARLCVRECRAARRARRA
ncbi:hypothetical protein M5362_00290 [Streptomyces sp. Je 1-79]|uniref:hypothetical protein n=1 Tax=Streptomyces sp. Je 1-79 TaxID=2943847 RepID=UPI0021A31CA7|nr:hypothetical protein [Streptomyces sp. Je 1-79]MCT4351570.1 hypothetical protein [Streptomyces sp. Je 1-79]